MKAPRHAQWLVVSALTLGLALSTVVSAGAMEPEAKEEVASPRAASPEAQSKAEPEAVEPEAAELEAAEPEEAEPEAGESVKAEPGGSPDGRPEGATPTGDQEVPAGDGSSAGAGDPDDSPEPGAAGDEPGPGEEPSTSSPEEQGTVTVRPGPVTSLSPEGEPIGDAPSREVVVDPRRRFSDRHIMVRASVLAFGAAGLALVPTVVGLHQRAYAGGVLDQLETPSEADARPEVERYRRSMTTMAIVSGAVSGASVMAGAVLLGVGLRRHDAPPKTTVAPAVGSGTAGLMLRGRF